MTLSEIETILEELALRHQNLNNELLTTLLQSAGWEEKNIKDALMLFRQRGDVQTGVKTDKVSSDTVVTEATVSAEGKATESVQSSEITFYDTDGKEEKVLHEFETIETPREVVEDTSLLSKAAAAIPEVVLVETVVPPKVESVPDIVKEEIIVPPVEVRKESPVLPQNVVQDIDLITGDRNVTPPDTSPSVIDQIVKAVSFIEPVPTQTQMQAVAHTKQEPHSLITPKEPAPQKATKKQAEIPDDLPLLPFESSEQVWPFSRYKDVFHGEVMPDVVVSQPEYPKKESATIAVVVPPKPPKLLPEDELEIDLEKTPMTKGDESLVFLAGLMLFVIILILGYMYSNGRL